jgi:hypothetical protein
VKRPSKIGKYNKKPKRKGGNKPAPALNDLTKPLANPHDVKAGFNCKGHNIPSSQVTGAINRGMQYKNAGTHAMEITPKGRGGKFDPDFPKNSDNREGLKFAGACVKAPRGSIHEFPILRSGQVVNQGSRDPRSVSNPGPDRTFFMIEGDVPTFCGVGTRADGNKFEPCT